MKSKLKGPDFEEYVQHFDIVCLYETKLTNYDSIDIHGFELHAKNRGIERRVASGGVGLQIADKHKDKVKILEPSSDHVLWCIVERSVLSSRNDVLIGSVYVPPENSKYSDISMFAELEEEFVEICSKHSMPLDVVIAGDLAL